jgi:hypothetical protein
MPEIHLQVSRTVEVAAVAASVAMFVATVLAIPIFFAKIPDDFFVRRSRHTLAKRALRNAAGWLLVLLGIAMLVLPGQGLLTLLVGLTLVDFPGKHRLLRWALLQPKMKHALDALREKAGRGPLVPPDGEPA